MQLIWTIIGWIKAGWDWFQFGDAILAVLSKWFGAATVSSLVAALVGAWAQVSGYEIVLMALFVFVAINLALILRHLRRKKSAIALRPVVSMSQDGLYPAKYIQIAVRADGVNLLGCQVMLREVARDGGPVVYSVGQNAAWSGTKDRVIDINDGQEQFANLFSVSRSIATEQYILFPRTAHEDERLRLTTQNPNVYRLKVQASSQTSPPEEKTYLLLWGGNLDDVHLVETKS